MIVYTSMSIASRRLQVVQFKDKNVNAKINKYTGRSKIAQQLATELKDGKQIVISILITNTNIFQTTVHQEDGNIPRNLAGKISTSKKCCFWQAVCRNQDL